MTNQLEKKDEDLVIKGKFCKTMYELIRSDDFERIFGIVLKKVGRDKEYFLGILDRIKDGEKLEKEEKDLFLDLLDNELFQEKSNKIVKRLKGFTLEESKKFLEEYPTEEVIEYLTGIINNKILDISGFKYGIEIIESKEIGGENYLKLEIKGKDGESKYCVKKEKDIKNIKEEDFIFDAIGYIKEVNGKIYYNAKLNNKWGYIEYGKEEEAEKKFIFDYVSDIQEINGKIYYIAVLNDKWGYVKFGKEEIADINYEYSELGSLKVDKEGVYFMYKGEKIYVDKD